MVEESKTSLCCCFRNVLIASLGIFFIASGCYMSTNWIDLFTKLRGKKMALSPTSPAFSGWRVSPIPLFFDVYLFNWTNPEDFTAGSPRKPRFQELGPYRFREMPNKTRIEWHNHNASLTYRNFATFHFDAEASKGRLDDLVTSVNPVVYEVARRVKDESFFVKLGINAILGYPSTSLSTTKTAEEWMFKGYEDGLISMSDVLSNLNKEFTVPYDRIGYLYTRNNSDTYDGLFNVYTGADNPYKMGQIHSWNYKTHTGVYEGKCGEIKGSMGQFFPPNIQTNDTLYIYLPNICRAMPLDYIKTMEVHGVKTYKFAGSYRSLDNGTLYPENKCFCVNGECPLSGVFNVGPCKYNSSAYISYPHFYLADPTYLSAVEGLNPDPEKHEFFMAIEPTAGVPMSVGGGFQANILLEPIKGIYQYENIPRTFIPLMWAEERVIVPQDIADSVALVPRIVLLGQVITGIVLAIGILMTCWYPTKCIKMMFGNPKAKAKILVTTPEIMDTVSANLKRPFEKKASNTKGKLKSTSETEEGSLSLLHSQGSTYYRRQNS